MVRTVYTQNTNLMIFEDLNLLFNSRIFHFQKTMWKVLKEIKISVRASHNYSGFLDSFKCSAFRVVYMNPVQFVFI